MLTLSEVDDPPQVVSASSCELPDFELNHGQNKSKHKTGYDVNSNGSKT